MFLHAQNVVKSGKLPAISYEFTGPENYSEKKPLIYALAYSYSIDIGELSAKCTYQIHYQVVKLKGKGFETIISFRPVEKQGHLSLLGFDFSDQILPNLKQLKLFIEDNGEPIYVKPILLNKTDSAGFYFKFRHQRFDSQWTWHIKDIEWASPYQEELFKKNWENVANYYMANLYVNDLLKSDSTDIGMAAYLYKSRLLQLFHDFQNLDFYLQLIIGKGKDPEQLDKKLKIAQFVLERELAELNNEMADPSFTSNQWIESYVQIEKNLLTLNSKHNFLYGDLFFEFDPHQLSFFCRELINNNAFGFSITELDHLYQKWSLTTIEELINQQKAKEALFQMERFETFYKSSPYLFETLTYKRFKAMAVYEIYLSYIQVSKKALEQNQIDLALQYLTLASEIQNLYPTEIINDLYVEKEMRQLIKKAINRYQLLLDSGNFKEAQMVKKGILGLMKRLGMEQTLLPTG